MNVMDPARATRRWLAVGITGAAVLAGALFGVALTPLGKIVGGAPPATFGNYMWNAVSFGIMAGVVSPLVTWSVLRRAPLWRTVVQPLTLATAGGVAAALAGSGLLLLALPPIGLVAGFVWLARRYPQESNRLSSRASEARKAGATS